MNDVSTLGEQWNQQGAKPTPSRKPTKAQYEAAAQKGRWENSHAHDGWIHPDERYPDGSYIVRRDAEDACWLHGIEVVA